MLSVLWHTYQRCVSHQLTLGITWTDSPLNMTQPLWLTRSHLITNNNQETKSVWTWHLLYSLDLFLLGRSLIVRRLGWFMLLCPYSSSLAACDCNWLFSACLSFKTLGFMKTKKKDIPPDYGFIPTSQPKNWQYHRGVKSLWSGAWLLGSIYDSYLYYLCQFWWVT